MSDAVLDASALIASLKDEPGGRLVDPIVATSAMSAVNWAEVVAHFAQAGSPREHLSPAELAPGLEIVPLDLRQATEAGMLDQATRSAGLSLGDRACLALALTAGLPVITADRNWARVDVGVDVRLIR